MIGLDLGTTNSCAAIADFRGAVSTVALTPHNTPPYDSIVASTVLDPLSEDPVIGLEAQRRYREIPRSERQDHAYLNFFKLHMDEYRLKEKRLVVDRYDRRFDKLQQSELKDPVYRYEWSGGPYTRQELVGSATAILRRALQNATEQGGEPDRLMVGIPVAFSSRARKRMINALRQTEILNSYGELLDRVRFVLEPLAAAAAGMREAFDADDLERVLIFDHGGGTLDLSLIEFERREGFEAPVPVRELAASGAKDVAGGSMDDDFGKELTESREIREALASLDAWEAGQYVRAAKEDLSTLDEADLVVPGATFRVDKEMLERALAPILGRIEQETRRVLSRARIQPSDVTRVLLTGGSSLVPCVQDRVKTLFPELADKGRVRAYDPHERGDVERAITEVAQGLVHFASDEGIERVVLWDVDLVSSEGSEVVSVARRGARYGFDDDGRPQLRKTVELVDRNGDGMAIGLWETELDRPSFLFGIADVPPMSEPLRVEICLRPDALYPSIYVFDGDGALLERDWRLTGWEADGQVAADLSLLTEGQLEDFFEADHVDFLPDTPFEKFQHAPLTRPLHVGDRIEWTTYSPSFGGGPLSRGQGEIVNIRRQGEYEPLTEMDSMDVENFEFTVRADQGAATMQVNQPHGYIRLATRPSRRQRNPLDS